MVLHSDNDAVVTVVNTGRSKDGILQACLRWLCYLLAAMDCLIKMKHVSGHLNNIADKLSRSFGSQLDRKRCDEIISKNQLQELPVEPHMMIMLDYW